MTMIRTRAERLALFAIGGTAYIALEALWRDDATHWSMFFLGGLCLCLLDELNNRLRAPLPAAAAVGAAGVSGLELAFGIVSRTVFRYDVWNYADEWGNLAGLVCPKYTLFWFLLSFWVLLVMRGLRWFSGAVAARGTGGAAVVPKAESS